MKFDTDEYLTITEAAEAVGTLRRSLYRVINRAREAGHETVVTVLGRRLIHRDSLPVLKQYFYPFYSEGHQANVRKWGAMGGAAKARNAKTRSPSS